MSKLDEMRKASGGSIAESMGGGRATAAIPGEYRPTSLPAKLQGIRRRADVSDVPVDKIGPDPDQPRKHFDPEAIKRLAASLVARGQLQPIRVRWNPEREQYVVIVGERRYQAAVKAGLPTLACVVVEGEIPPDELLAIQLIENAVREDLLPIEQANAYQSLMAAKGWSQVELAAELGIGQPAVAKALATLKLPLPVQEQINRGELSPSAGAAIAGLDSPEEMVALANEAVQRDYSRDEVATAARRRKEVSKSAQPGGDKGRGAKAKLPSERPLKAANGLKVVVSGRKGFDLEAWLEALEDAVRQVRGKFEAGQGDDQAAA